MKKLKVFTDESSLNEQYLGYGGIFINEYCSAELEAILEEYAVKNGYAGREFSYKKCRKSNVDRYVGITNLFFDYLAKKKEETGELVADFRCLIVNTRTNEIQRTEKSWEEGFYKFYYQFITRSLMKITQEKDIEFEIDVADKTDSYKFRTEVLQNTVSGTLQKSYANRCIVNEIKRDRPKESRVHQMVDVLLGCVTNRFNEKESENKNALVECFEYRIEKRLNEDFKPKERPVNVWAWASSGQKRWVKGSNGIA